MLCVDEKTQIQALDRTQPTLPLRPGEARRMTPEPPWVGWRRRFATLPERMVAFMIANRGLCEHYAATYGNGVSFPQMLDLEVARLR